ncbi:hypothetical protein HK100_005934 [Physocladia obscura]|uniref:BZIP domain-containing protein n=1 Tax=Physocladia obscura TaxID=109957 RepID=A0AAD5ST58_9FUNG|nr:hypothetical protein HK100_005934 [Physocladia obscura]
MTTNDTINDQGAANSINTAAITPSNDTESQNQKPNWSSKSYQAARNRKNQRAFIERKRTRETTLQARVRELKKQLESAAKSKSRGDNSSGENNAIIYMNSGKGENIYNDNQVVHQIESENDALRQRIKLIQEACARFALGTLSSRSQDSENILSLSPATRNYSKSLDTPPYGSMAFPINSMVNKLDFFEDFLDFGSDSGND